jgi:hypothetical protein
MFNTGRSRSRIAERLRLHSNETALAPQRCIHWKIDYWIANYIIPELQSRRHKGSH